MSLTNFLVSSLSPFVVHRIPNSNLLLVFVNKMENLDTPVNDLTTDPKEIDRIDQYDCEHPCHKIYMNELPRRRLDECFVSAFEVSLNSLVTCLFRFTDLKSQGELRELEVLRSLLKSPRVHSVAARPALPLSHGTQLKNSHKKTFN